MMRRMLFSTLPLLLALVVACQKAPEQDVEEATPFLPTATATSETLLPRPTLTPPDPSRAPAATPTLEEYPGPSVPIATPEAYPPPTVATFIDAYPAGELVWILRPVGMQCADPEDVEFADLQAATAALAAIGVPVQASETVDLMVCSACSCPTSAHFRVQIDRIYLNSAISQGWQLEE